VLESLNLPSSSKIEVALYTNCSGTSLSGYVSNSLNCFNGGFVYSTGQLSLSPNTCYYLYITSSNGFPITSQFCAYSESPTYDECIGAKPIDSTPQQSDNYCTTSNITDPPPFDFCAISLENTAWYSFTVQSDGDVVITIDNINCYGGGNGFQIGFFSGSCGSLVNDGCINGSGGTVIATYPSLTAGQQLYVGIDGNAGSYCNYDISATNTVPLPIELLSFKGEYEKDENVVLLEWETLSEKNNDYFKVIKTYDGNVYKEVGTIKGSGNTNEVMKYWLIDDDLKYNKKCYYLLEQYDFNGKKNIISFDVVEIKNEKNNVVINPIIKNNNLIITSDVKSNFRIRLFDISGKVIFDKNIVIVEGENTIEVKDILKGIYLCTLQSYDNGILATSKVKSF
jgi:hypothetical protein